MCRFYEEALQLIKENEGQILGGIMRMVIDKSNGTGVSTLIKVEEYIRGRGFMYRGSALKFQITCIHVKECMLPWVGPEIFYTEE